MILFIGALIMGALSACTQTVAQPPEKLHMVVRAPSDADNPFLASPDGAFVAITAEGPELPADRYVNVQRYKSGMSVALPQLPFGVNRQIRIEVWSRDAASDKPLKPVGRGRSIPVNVSAEGAATTVHPYVTKINQFAPVVDDQGIAAKLEGRAGAASVALPNGQVLIAGGGTFSGTAKTPYDPASFSKFSDVVVAYDPDTRQLVSPSKSAESITLKFGRAQHGMAVGRSVVAIVGGYVQLDGTNKPTRSIEYYDISNGKMLTSVATSPDLFYARVHPAVMQMFDGEDYFLILGGKGDTPCSAGGNEVECAANTWEIWSPVDGAILKGRMNEARWNHAAVRLPAPDGGYAMLIGGENDGGVLGTFEVIQFNNGGSVAQKGFACSDPPPADGRCSPGQLDPNWQPIPGALRDGAGRTLMGAVFLANAKYNFVYMIGGFSDKDHKVASNRVDIFDIASGLYVDAGAEFALATARGAPIVAAAQTQSRSGQVLVAGGSSNETTHLDSAEFLWINPDEFKLTQIKDNVGTVTGEGLGGAHIFGVENALPGGNRTQGTAAALSTGHVLVAGGATGDAGAVTAQPALTLWNPF